MNDWLDYKGSGSVKSYANDELAHAFNFRSKIDKGVKAIGDVVTLPFKTGELGKQLQAYADLMAAKRRLYDLLVSKANKTNNERQYEQYKREAEKVAADIDKIKKDAESDISRYQRYIKDNEILGPIVRAIEDSAKALPSIANMTFDAAMTDLKSRR